MVAWGRSHEPSAGGSSADECGIRRGWGKGKGGEGFAYKCLPPSAHMPPTPIDLSGYDVSGAAARNL